MKVFTVNGFKHSGKTTTIEAIIKELKRRGYSVGTIKSIHDQDFSIDTPGTNTDRHRAAGAELVTALSENETAIMFQQRLSIGRILSYYNQDFVILEGVEDMNAPRIVTAHDTDGIEAKLDNKTIAIAGVYSNIENHYNNIPVINALKHIEDLVDRIEQKVPDMMHDLAPECCTACGMSCRELLVKILSGEKKRSDCIIDQSDIKVTINGKQIPMAPFVQKIVKNSALSVLSELDGYQQNVPIHISIGESES